mmetsp:Transcript_23446/g.54467  ORF Transcript_23446/g.54467 Transcript_23446/m.54467 type:complete len:207 (+) Transcript_23446:366-986(+)
MLPLPKHFPHRMEGENQDRGSKEWKTNPFFSYINPLENQAYSNNPNGKGRANPLLPRVIQDRLEQMGLIQSSLDDSSTTTKSTQSILLEKRRIRNVVSFAIPRMPNSANPRQSRQKRATLTVDIEFDTNPRDPRRLRVKFDSCRINIPQSRFRVTFPLGMFGPTGWLKTAYIDDTLRVTRGHKGSVFVLSRQASSPKGKELSRETP